MVEAVIVLPLFIVIFLSLLYVRDQVLARQQAQTEARRCAWLYSMKNCQVVPPECAEVLGPPSNGSAADPAVEPAIRKATSEATGDATGVISKVISPLLEVAIDAALGSSATAAANREIERPRLVGGGTKTVQGRYDLACNLAPSDPVDVAIDAWNHFDF